MFNKKTEILLIKFMSLIIKGSNFYVIVLIKQQINKNVLKIN